MSSHRRVTRLALAAVIALSAVAVVGSPAGAQLPVVSGTLTADDGSVDGTWTTDTPGIAFIAVLFDAPSECPPLTETSEVTSALAIPPILATSESGSFTIESGTPVLDNLDPDAGEIPLPDGLYEICLYWAVPGSVGGDLVTSLEAEIRSPAPEPTTTTTAAPTTTTTAAPAEPVTPRYTG